MSDSPQTDAAAPPEGDGLEGYRARYDHYRARGLDHNAAQRAASNKGATGASSDRPPRAPRGGRGSGGPGAGSGKRTTATARTVRELVSTLGGTVAMFDGYTGAVLIERAPDLGQAVAKAAEHDARFRKAVEGFSAGGVYGGLIFCGLSILVPILARWGLIPEPWGSRLAFALAPEAVKSQMAAPPTPATSAETPPERTAQGDRAGFAQAASA